MSSLYEIARHQIRIVMTRPMNIASGVVTPLLFMTLLTAPRLGRMTPEQMTASFTGSLLASLWASSLWSGAGILRRERSGGTLAPSFTGRIAPHLVYVAKVVGGVLYDTSLIVVTQTVFMLGTGMQLRIADPLAFAVGLAAVVACGIASSVMIGALLMLSRYAFQLTTALGTPVLLLGGTLIPLTMLPDWVSWLGRLINLSWLQQFMVSTAHTPRWGMLAIGVAISVVYAVIGMRAVGVLLARARKEATLDFA